MGELLYLSEKGTLSRSEQELLRQEISTGTDIL
jgi:hypothetical protein